jgi:hypothetical protein
VSRTPNAGAKRAGPDAAEHRHNDVFVGANAVDGYTLERYALEKYDVRGPPVQVRLDCRRNRQRPAGRREIVPGGKNQSCGYSCPLGGFEPFFSGVQRRSPRSKLPMNIDRFRGLMFHAGSLNPP